MPFSLFTIKFLFEKVNLELFLFENLGNAIVKKRVSMYNEKNIDTNLG